ncbi:tigger transposable element-derived protein 4 [Trichonephila clavipes]|nr:tigger transposable element-derived protein 4 [Trichonephila clavipes]
MALTFGFPPNSLSTIIRNRDKLRNYDSLNSCSKYRRTCVHEDFDEAVMKWIHTMQDQNVLISEPFVIEKAFPFVKNVGGRTGKILRPSSVALKSKNQEINRLQLAVKLPWAIFFESVDILS